MFFDDKEYEEAGYRCLQPLLDSVDEAQKAGDGSPNDTSLNKRQMTEQSGLPRHTVERLSNEPVVDSSFAATAKELRIAGSRRNG